MRIKITGDSTIDLSPSLLERYDISTIPLYIMKGDASYRDQLEIKPEDIFEYVESGKGICHTAAVNTIDYTEFFTTLLQDYDAVIHINISSDLSCCNQNALIAARELENVYVIDSRNLSSGSGHLAVDAAIMAQSGMAPQAIAEKLTEMTKLVEASFVIDTLKYLHKGGRCSAVAALGANLLKLKPCIEVSNGKMDVGKKYRGNFDKVILQYAADKLANYRDLDPRRLFITYAPGTPPAIADSVEEYARSLGYFEEICQTIAGCTISNHCGPVCLGVLYYRKA